MMEKTLESAKELAKNLATMIAEDKKKMIQEAWLRAFNRYPSISEEARAMKHLEQAKSIKEGMEDLLWGLMNTKEFILNR